MEVGASMRRASPPLARSHIHLCFLRRGGMMGRRVMGMRVWHVGDEEVVVALVTC